MKINERSLCLNQEKREKERGQRIKSSRGWKGKGGSSLQKKEKRKNKKSGFWKEGLESRVVKKGDCLSTKGGRKVGKAHEVEKGEKGQVKTARVAFAMNAKVWGDYEETSRPYGKRGNKRVLKEEGRNKEPREGTKTRTRGETTQKDIWREKSPCEATEVSGVIPEKRESTHLN